MFNHVFFSSYEGRKERRPGKIREAFSRMHRTLDGWLARRLHQLKASTTMDLGIPNLLISERCVALKTLDLLIKTDLSVICPLCLLRTLVVSRRQQSESIEVALDMEQGGLMNRFDIGRCHCL